MNYNLVASAIYKNELIMNWKLLGENEKNVSDFVLEKYFLNITRAQFIKEK